MLFHTNLFPMWVHSTHPFSIKWCGQNWRLITFSSYSNISLSDQTNCASSLSFRIIASYWLSNTKRDLLGKKRDQFDVPLCTHVYKIYCNSQISCFWLWKGIHCEKRGKFTVLCAHKYMKFIILRNSASSFHFCF